MRCDRSKCARHIEPNDNENWQRFNFHGEEITICEDCVNGLFEWLGMKP